MDTASPLPSPLARAHAWARSQGWLRRFTLANRILLAMAFLPTGLVKMLGRRFTVLPVDNPVGFSGALLFLPVGLSVFLITWGVGFGNTVWVTAGMLLAAVYLVCWDGDRIWAAGAELFRRDPQGGRLLAGANRVELTGWAAGAACGMGLFLITRGFLPSSLTLPLLAAGGAAALLVVAGWAVELLKAPAAPPDGRPAR